MEAEGSGGVKEVREEQEKRIEKLHNTQLELIASLQTIVPDIVSSLDLSLKTISSFNGKPFIPLPNPLPVPEGRGRGRGWGGGQRQSGTMESVSVYLQPESSKASVCSGVDHEEMLKRRGVFGTSETWEEQQSQGMMRGGGGQRGTVGMMGMPRGVGVPPPMSRPPVGGGGGGGNCVALKPRTEEDEMKDLENMLNKKSFKEMQKSKTGEELLDLIHRPTAKEFAVAARMEAPPECEGTGGAKEVREQLENRIERLHNAQLELIASLQTKVPDIISSLDLSLKTISSFNGKPFIPLPNPLPLSRGGQSGPMESVCVDLKQLPKSKASVSRGNHEEMVKRRGVFGTSETWERHPHMKGMTRGGGQRGMVGMMGMPRGVGVPPLMSRPSVRGGGGGNSIALKTRTEEDEMKDVENMLNKKSFKEMQKSKTGEELFDLIHRPTAKEFAVASRFKSKGGSQVKEYCSALTKEDCRRQTGSYIACDKVHFRRIIAAHTDVNLGDCSFLDTCRHMKTCKYVHYELDSTPDVSPLMMGAATFPPPKPLKPQRAHYCSEVELGEPQWINCDIRSFRMDILGQFGVIMADPPWDIHMELPYGTMADDEMRTLNVPALQTDGLIFLWVTGRAMELGRECLELWGYKRVEEIIWVKTNQLQRIIRTGRTGHWLNHSKEHCLVGIKGNPEVNRNIDTDVIVAEVRETSRKPDEMYSLLERISPRTRKLELFARMHNVHAGWMSLGNQLQGVRLVDEGLRARFKAAYADVEVQPASPPRPSAMEVDSSSNQMRNTFAGGELKAAGTQVAEATALDAACATEAKAVNRDVEMTS